MFVTINLLNITMGPIFLIIFASEHTVLDYPVCYTRIYHFSDIVHDFVCFLYSRPMFLSRLGAFGGREYFLHFCILHNMWHSTKHIGDKFNSLF